MDIRLLKESNNSISKNTILSLLSDVFLKKIEDVRNFSPIEVYYKGDIVYSYNKALNKHELYSCLKDGVSGQFNPSDWDDLIINMGGSTTSETCSHTRCVESIFVQTYTATENTSIIPLEKQFDYMKDSIMLFHSTMGLLSMDEYRVNDLGSSIRLRRKLLNANESITYYIFVGGDGKIGYNSMKEHIQYANVANQNEFEIFLDYKPFTDIMMVFNSINILIPPTEYSIENNKVILNEGIQLNEKITMVTLGKNYDNEKIVQIYQTTSKINTLNTTNIILPFKKNEETEFMVFHSLHGLITRDHYSIENDRITFDFELKYGEELYFVVTSRKPVITNITESSGIMSVTAKDIDEELYSHIIGTPGRVALTKDSPKKKINLDVPATTENYDIDIVILSSDGDVGDIILSNKTYKSFELEFNGIAKNVLIEYTIKGAIGIQRSSRIAALHSEFANGLYQTVDDEDLTTNDKTIVGAINEINSLIDTKVSFDFIESEEDEDDDETRSLNTNVFNDHQNINLVLRDGKIVAHVEGEGYFELFTKPIE